MRFDEKQQREAFEKWFMSGAYGQRPYDRFDEKEVSEDAVFEVWRSATEQASQPQVPEAYRKLEKWARKLPTPVCANGVLPLAGELNELDEILAEIGR